MSAAAFDLGVRLRARATGRVQPRMLTTPYFLSGPRVAVDVTPKNVVTVHFDGRTPVTGRGRPGLTPLIEALPHPTDPTSLPHTLVVADRVTLRRLIALAAGADPGTAVFRVGALLDFWQQQAEQPGRPTVLVVTEACRLRWVTGADPDDERDVDVWRRWLDVDAEGTDGMLALADLLAAGRPNPHLAIDDGLDPYEWNLLRRSLDADEDWRRPDSTSGSMIGSDCREDAAAYFDRALMEDPMWRARARAAGHVVLGRITNVGVDVTLVNADAGVAPRFREGKEVHLRLRDSFLGSEVVTAKGVVTEYGIDAQGRDTLTVKPRRNRSRDDAPDLLSLARAGDPIEVAPELIEQQSQRRRRAQTAKRLRLAPWVARRGAQPGVDTVANRVPPIDVLMAGASDE